VEELYGVPLIGGSAVKLNGSLVTGGDVSFDLQFSSDSSRLFYRADQVVDEMIELYGVPLTGGTPIKINDSLVSGGTVIYGYSVSSDNSRVTYIADQDTDEVYELYVTDLNVERTLYLPLVLR